MEKDNVSTAALLEVQVILERYLAYSMTAPDALDKILAIVDRPEVAHTLDSDLPLAPVLSVERNSFASFP
jgi:hypothetical protein